MTKTLTRAITTKKGIVFAAGEKVTVAFDVKNSLSGEKSSGVYSGTASDGRRFISANFATIGLKMPSLATLERYSDDGIAKSVFGEKVEPDGWDAHGSPSWLLVAGVI